MLDFADAPYRFTPPAPNALVAWALRRFNYRWYLPRKQRIESVTVEGAEALQQMRRPGDAVLLLPNHPTHADAAILIEALRQVGVRTRMMAAYDVFLRSRLDAWVMRKLGAFSVDREGSDQAAMKEAMRTLTELSKPGKGGWALTIFPEGNVYLEGDRVTPFNDGAAFLALRAAKALAERSRAVWAVPVSIKATHTTDVRDALRQRLTALAAEVGVEAEVSGDIHQTLRAVGEAALRRNLKQRGLDQPQADDLRGLIDAAADAVLKDLERKLELTPKAGSSAIDRVRAARRVIHEVRTDPTRSVDHAAARVWADQAMLAFRIASYSGNYVAAKPTVDRVAETIEKLDEDLHGRWPRPWAERAAHVCFGEPIDVRGYLGEKRTRDAVMKLTRDVEGTVQAGLDAINAGLKSAGSGAW
jgi:1-acyl-sn-glycerol-3-phosphate acyltransferase